ncbi:MAG: hypothetical protein QXG00_03950 [Candidatus Woesearchaeota archaeon]
MKTNSFLAVFIFIFLIFTVFVNYTLVVKTDKFVKQLVPPTTGRASSAVINLCINGPPYFNISVCNSTVYQNTQYTCNLSAVDPTNNSLYFSSVWLTNLSLFTITPDGRISFYANQTHADLENHSVYIILDDNYGCNNSQFFSLFNLRVINVNDPPYLVQNIPNREISEKQLIRNAFCLDNFFYDPDKDPLSYFQISNNSVMFSISQNYPHCVELYSSVCGITETFIVNASDPYNLSALSNPFSITVTCPSEPSASPNGGGGAGGGSSSRTCTPDWHCYRWSECYPNGTRTQRCVDINACNPKDYIRVRIEECVYNPQYPCEERWTCSDWGLCLPNGTQLRTCTDNNECNTFNTKPNEIQNCTYIPTCFDGIQNQNEYGVDCGGPCKPCPLHIPSPIPPETTLWVIITIAIILFLIILLIIYRIFHKEINEFFARVGWYLSKKRRKQILINQAVKEELLKKLSDLEKDFNKKDLGSLIGLFTGLVRIYYKEVFNLKYEFNLQQLFIAVKNRKMMYTIVKNILYSFAQKSAQVEFGKIKIYKFELQYLIDEFRQIIIQTSLTEDKDLGQEIKERKPLTEHRYEHFYIWLSNAEIALQYNRNDVAKRIYIDMLRRFEYLTPQEKDRIYFDMTRLYNEIRYVGSEY